MRYLLSIAVSLSILLSSTVLAQERSDAEVIVAALSPLPTDLRAEAGVIVEDPDGNFDWIRDSSNGMSCVLRQPRQDGEKAFLDARCYSDTFWPAVLHNWTLDPAPENYKEAHARMEAAFAAGLVELPSVPTAGYRVYGPLSDYDFSTGEIGPSLQKWQSIHFPYRTSAEMGLTESEEASKREGAGLMPFVMASGTWWSHVMIMHEPWPWD